MKKLIIILITLHSSLFTLHSSAQGDWYPLFPEPTGNDLSDVCFVDDNNGWAVGEKGTILHTTDGGESWEYQVGGTDLRLRSIHFTDYQNGWIVGGETHPIPGEYIILHTSDGGNNWSIQAEDTTTYLRSVFFIDSESGWAVGEGIVFHTTDGGINWISQWNGPSYIDFKEVFFYDSVNGWIASESGLYATTDGGSEWIQKINGYFLSVFFINPNEGWASTMGIGYGAGYVFHTSDGFTTWDTIKACGNYDSSCDYYSIFFKDSNNGWILHDFCSWGGWVSGCAHYLYRTEDGGNTWLEVYLPVTINPYALSFTAQGKGCIVGSHGVILTTNNWEDDWSESSNGNFIGLNSITFTDGLNGWVAGSEQYIPNWANSGSIIMHTTDAGLNWEGQDNPATGPIQSIHFIDNTNGWAIGNSYHRDTAYILNTTNGGEDWLIQVLYTNYIFEDVTFIDGSSGWVVGWYDYEDDDEGRILKTSDGGITWSEQPCDKCNSLYSVFFIDQDIGWVGGKEIYHTSDGGETWIIQDYDTTGYDIESIFFIDENKGWAVGNKWASSWNIILKTESGGETWSYEMVSHGVSSVHFKDEHNGLISTTDGTILFTQDGGDIWEEMDSGTENPLFSVYYTPEGQGYAAGCWGTIVKSYLLTASVEKPISGTQHSKLNIQNYPNPTSGIVNFQFSTFNFQSVSLKIYDLHGREVATVVDKQFPEGEHVVSFDASHLPPGVYIWHQSSVVPPPFHYGRAGSRQSSVGKLIKF